MIADNTNIPENWKWVTLDDIGITVSGGTPSTNEPEYWNGDIPWITPADLSNYNDVYITSGSRCISQIGLEHSSASILPENSILFSSRAPIGYVAIAKNNLTTNQGFKNLILNKYINPKYVYYYLKTIKSFAEDLASGTTFLELSATKFKQIPFPLTSLEEQTRIVERIEEILSELDKNLQQLNKSLIDVENLWRISLNKFTVNQSPLISLDKIVTIKGGKRLPKNAAYTAGKTEFPYIRVTDFSNYSIDEDNLKYISKDVYEKLKNYSIDSNDVYISIAGSIGLIGSIPNKISTAILTENAAKLTLDSKKIIKEYLIYVLDSPFVKNQISKSIKATSQPKLALYKIAEINIPNYSVEEQKQIVEKLDDIKINCYKLKSSIIKNISSTINTKNKILSDAFRGKLLLNIDSESNIEDILEKIKTEKAKYIQLQIELDKRTTRTSKIKKDLLNVLKLNFKKNGFSFEDILKTNSMSVDTMEIEFKVLIEKGKVKKEYDEKSKAIKFYLV